MRTNKFSGIIISHLGNINGANEEQENRLAYIKKALDAGWHVCAAVIFRSGGFLLPRYGGFDSVPASFLSKQRVWCNALTPETLDALCNVGAHCFCMSPQPYSLTSAQFIWTLPDNPLTDRSIAAFPEDAAANWLDNFEPAGICSEFPVNYI
jgi:hypothetical protein